MFTTHFRKSELARIAVWGALSITMGQSAALAQGWPTGQPPAVAGNSSSEPMPNSVQADTEAYWTAQRLMSARPVELAPSVGTNGLPDAPQVAPDSTPGVRSAGSLPTVAANSFAPNTLIPEVFLQPANSTAAHSVEPNNSIPNATSSFGAYFTTSRVFPDSATTAYPNLTAGKLFFSDPRTGGNFVCSAATLQRRLVVTAGHCVTRPSTNPTLRYFYTNFLFVPAFRNGIAPVGTWTPRIVWVSNTWYFSNGSVPNAQDVGMLVMNDRSGVPIGNVTGWLGYFTNQLVRNHATVIGYPCNLDNCQRMQINQSQIVGSGGNNTYLYGSAMRGGSSGSAIIQDHGVRPSSNPFASLANNYLIGVVSYGPVATEPKYQGASNLDSRFISLKNSACGAAGSGNCI